MSEIQPLCMVSIIRTVGRTLIVGGEVCVYSCVSRQFSIQVDQSVCVLSTRSRYITRRWFNATSCPVLCSDLPKKDVFLVRSIVLGSYRYFGFYGGFFDLGFKDLQHDQFDDAV